MGGEGGEGGEGGRLSENNEGVGARGVVGSSGYSYSHPHTSAYTRHESPSEYILMVTKHTLTVTSSSPTNCSQLTVNSEQ